MGRDAWEKRPKIWLGQGVLTPPPPPPGVGSSENAPGLSPSHARRETNSVTGHLSEQERHPLHSNGHCGSDNLKEKTRIVENVAQLKIRRPIRQLTASLVAQLVKNPPAMRETWVGKIPWRREWLPTPVFWPGDFHGLVE